MRLCICKSPVPDAGMRYCALCNSWLSQERKEQLRKAAPKPLPLGTPGSTVATRLGAAGVAHATRNAAQAKAAQIDMSRPLDQLYEKRHGTAPRGGELFTLVVITKARHSVTLERADEAEEDPVTGIETAWFLTRVQTLAPKVKLRVPVPTARAVTVWVGRLEDELKKDCTRRKKP